ncbi:MAG: methyltransferase domain-containing protein [Rhodocyclaceae bacterium]|nr:methyltransferase domain-containing protein [Rhodocyclaceae bacterium]
MKARFRQWLLDRQFRPGCWGIFVNPFFLARRALWGAIHDERNLLSGKLLDVGCGHKPYRALFDVESYVGLEIDTPESRARGVADAYYDGKIFPFEDASFDAVLCNQVLEHVFTPIDFLSEIRRVLTPGGRLLLTVPFVWDEHEQPFDFARYSSFGLKYLLEQQGFKVVRQRKMLNDASLLFQLLIAYLVKVLPVPKAPLQIILTLVLYAPISTFGLLIGRALPKNQDLFLDQLVVAERL